MGISRLPGGAERVHGEDAQWRWCSRRQDEVVAGAQGGEFGGRGEALEVVIGAGDVDFGLGEIHFGGDEVEPPAMAVVWMMPAMGWSPSRMS